MAINEKKRRKPSILSIRAAKGRLTWAGHDLDVTFSLRVTREGRVSLDFRPLPLTKDRVWVLDVTQSKSRFAMSATLTASTTDGRKIESEHVYFETRNIGTGPKGSFLKLSARASRLRIQDAPLPKTSSGLQLSYLTVGMRGFHVQTAQSRAGQIRIGAPSDEPRVGELSGFVVVNADGSRPLAAWLRSADDMVERVLAMISLAEGRSIPWSIRSIVRDRKTLQTEFSGSTSTSYGHDGVGHFLNLQPFLDLGVNRYTKALQQRTGIQVALNWFLFSPTHMELQLVAAMTAVEHLVATYVKRHGSPTILHPRTFSAIDRKVRKVFAAAQKSLRGTNVQERRRQVARVRDKFAHNNEASLRDKLAAMIEFYAVPVAGLERAINKAVQARNIGVHTGLYHDYTKYRELYLHVVVLRELLKRIFFAMLGYAGQYHSMLNGPEWVQFPPKGPTPVSPP